jgi:hypothetical protein
MQALWLANTSSVILFYPYLKASFLVPIKQILGLTMEFKTTLKGGRQARHPLSPAFFASFVPSTTCKTCCFLRSGITSRLPAA